MGNPTLEQAIYDDPDDREAWQVYADWLEQQDDPRGEIIALDLAAEQAEGTARAELEARKAALEAEHRADLLGPLAELLGEHEHEHELADAVELEWSRGYVVKAKIGYSDEDWEGPAIDSIVSALVGSPAARFLREVWLGTSFDEDEDWIGLFDRNLAALTGAGPLEALTRLTVADTEDYWDISSTRVGDITAALRAAPRLRELRVVGADIELEPLVHESLTSLRLETGGLPGATAAALSSSSFPALTELTVYLGDPNYGASASVEDFAGLLSGAKLPSLRHLGLVNAERQAQISGEVARSPILAQLRSLDLSMGTLSDGGLLFIVAHPAKFAHLERLDLSQSFITEAGAAQLRASLPKVDIELGGQRQPYVHGGQERYYVSVGE